MLTIKSKWLAVMLSGLMIFIGSDALGANDRNEWGVLHSKSGTSFAYIYAKNSKYDSLLITYNPRFECIPYVVVRGYVSKDTPPEEWHTEYVIEGNEFQFRVDKKTLFHINFFDTVVYKADEGNLPVMMMEPDFETKKNREKFLKELAEGYILRFRMFVDGETDIYKFMLKGSANKMAIAKASCLANMEKKPPKAKPTKSTNSDEGFFNI